MARTRPRGIPQQLSKLSEEDIRIGIEVDLASADRTEDGASENPESTLVRKGDTSVSPKRSSRARTPIWANREMWVVQQIVKKKLPGRFLQFCGFQGFFVGEWKIATRCTKELPAFSFSSTQRFFVVVCVHAWVIEMEDRYFVQ